MGARSVTWRWFLRRKGARTSAVESTFARLSVLHHIHPQFIYVDDTVCEVMRVDRHGAVGHSTAWRVDAATLRTN